MNSITLKICKKFALHLPFGIVAGVLIILIIWGIDPFYWQMGVLLGFAISLFVIMLNINEYNSIEHIALKDYLESKHRIKFPDNEVIWNNFSELIEKQFIKHDIITDNPNEIIVLVSNSIIKMKRINEEIELSIGRKAFRFLPDKGQNYLMFQRIVRALDVQLFQDDE